MIYQPAEDSYFLSEILKKQIPKLLVKNPNLTFLEIGTGSGIQLETAHSSGIKTENIFSSDINKASVQHCNLLGYSCIYSDLFENIKDKFDLIVFNPPYLPEHEYDKEKDTSGGKDGDETIIRFLQQAKEHLNTNGKIFLLLSSRTPLENIEKELQTNNYKKKFLGNERLFYEDLSIWELSF
jgi:release factor glutamine methyltransferase